MNRNHKVFTFVVSFDRQVMVPDTIGSGEMHRTGQVERDSHTLLVVAASRAIAYAWMTETGYRFPNLDVHGCTEATIDAIIETHTF
jgi:hypothetical protein